MVLISCDQSVVLAAGPVAGLVVAQLAGQLAEQLLGQLGAGELAVPRLLPATSITNPVER